RDTPPPHHNADVSAGSIKHRRAHTASRRPESSSVSLHPASPFCLHLALSTMSQHKEFDTAGKKPGLQVWRIEKMDLAPVPPELHGNFYTGDSYILLHTTSAPSYNVHSWFAPIQFTEFQNQESNSFLSYFKYGITYKKGGVASGFNHIVTNHLDIQRLLHVKGRRVIKASEVPMKWSSFNRGDCFIIQLKECIYHWAGSECNMFERLKTTEMAIGIRDNELHCRAQIEMIDEGSEPEAVIQISDAAGSMTTNLVAKENPFKQEMLSPGECYILDNGSDANKDERQESMSAASNSSHQKLLPKNSDHSDASRGESTLFKQFFTNWLDKDETTGPSKAYTIGSIANVEQIPFDASKLHDNKSWLPSTAWWTTALDSQGGDKIPVDPSKYGQFFGGDCYLVLYSYTDGCREKHNIYIWQGLKCSRDELAASAFLTVQLDDSMGGAATQEKPLVVHLGGTSREGGESKPGCTRLFHIRLSSTKATRAVEVEPTASSLNTNDVFVLKTPDSLFLWKGKGAAPEEMGAAQHVATMLGGTATVVEETKEKNGFWSALGGKKQYQTSKSLQGMAEEVPGEYSQIDLLPDDVMILDTWNQIFVWVGKQANETEKKGSPTIAKDYVKADPSGREGVPISIIKQGEEPLYFTGWFLAWDSKMWEKDPLECIKASLRKQ
ncbi:hypothetical protein F7725_028253, partial [Dissostichus mawsoni]